MGENPRAQYRAYSCRSIESSDPAVQVGTDRVVMGSDWPFVPWHPSPVAWIENRASLTAAEKEKILWKNLVELLDIQ